MMKQRVLSVLTLFTTMGTLVCCALPALFVFLGFGAALAGLVSAVPGLVWISVNKLWFFVAGGSLLAVGGVLRFRARAVVCPTDPKLAGVCARTRDWSGWVYAGSLGLYSIAAFFAFIAPRLAAG